MIKQSRVIKRHNSSSWYVANVPLVASRDITFFKTKRDALRWLAGESLESAVVAGYTIHYLFYRIVKSPVWSFT